MSKKLNVGGTVYEYPDQGTNPDWGEEAADWAEAVTEALNSLSSQDDVLRTTFTIQNNITEPLPVGGLSFFTGRVRTAFVDYTISRKATTPTPIELVESGQMILTYHDTTNEWSVVQDHVGLAGVLFTVTPGGQVEYTSTDLEGQDYSQMVFSAKAYIR